MNAAALLRRRHTERPTGPLHGYKLGYPMLSADAGQAGFTGVGMGSSVVYAPEADAVCVQVPRHRCPARRCDCGFYCLYRIDEGRELASEPEHRQAVLLEVAAFGRYIRYERGLRYSTQAVRAVRVGRCACGCPGEMLADVGGGAVGWRRLAASCPGCSGEHPALSLDDFARLAGVEVTVDDAVLASAQRFRTPVDAGVPEGEAVAQLTAEASLLQARLDELQAQLNRLTHGGRRG